MCSGWKYLPYTGVGARTTPLAYLLLIEDIAFHLAEEGWSLRSGGAEGADTFFEKGAERSSFFKSKREIYIPWNGFNRRDTSCAIVPSRESMERAMEIVSKVHPAWGRLERGARLLHARNAFQVLGNNLDSPSKMLICWSPVMRNGNIKGGTRTAWELAQKYEIPCFNLANMEDEHRIKVWLRDRK